MIDRVRSHRTGLSAMFTIAAALVASAPHAAAVAASSETAIRVDTSIPVSASHATLVSGTVAAPLSAHEDVAKSPDRAAAKREVMAHSETATPAPLSTQHETSVAQSADASKSAHSTEGTTSSVTAVHMVEATTASAAAAHNPENSLALPLGAAAAAAAAGTIANASSAAHPETAAPPVATALRVASIDASDASRTGTLSAIAPANERRVPDRNEIKGETALPVSVRHTGYVTAPPKSSSKIIRTAVISTGPRSKANRIRNRVWIRHPLD